jgi:mRNA-degrading endonuclease RelE of RelBE toxin-antitoxin system
VAKYSAVFTKTFVRELKKLSAIDRKRVRDKILILEDNPHHPSLRTKKLEGNPGRMESSVSKSIRIIWRFSGVQIIVALDVGHHDVLKKY